MSGSLTVRSLLDWQLKHCTLRAYGSGAKTGHQTVRKFNTLDFGCLNHVPQGLYTRRLYTWTQTVGVFGDDVYDEN